MKLIDVLRRECIVAGARLQDKADALRQIVKAAKKSEVLKDAAEDAVLEALRAREALGSTGFGKGIAIPHCRLKGIEDFVVGIITAPSGVDFESLDQEKVFLFVFIIAPEAESNRHLKLLSAISQTLLVPGAVKEILSAGSSEGVCESFLRHTHGEIDTKRQTAKVVFHVFIQEENLFHDILEKLAGIETGSLVISNTENAAAYLSKAPLFADFWRDKPERFSRVITLVVDKGLSNETIRRIESVTGDLNESESVMVIAQHVSYAAGSI